MGYIQITKVDKSQLSYCDSCQQEGLTTSGCDIKDVHGVVVMWFCFNCANKMSK